MTDTVEVINLGWGRTGTVSFYKAMQILGYNIYHMNNIGDNYRHNDFWIKVFEGNDSNFEEIFEGLKPLAVCDFPCALQYDKLLQQYPNAKIILQIREPESWYRSYRNTVLKVWPDHPHADQNLPFGIKVLFFLGLSPVKLKLMRFMSKAAWNDNYDKDNIIKSMQNWNQMVIDTFPPERLLIFRVEDGWEPLCRLDSIVCLI